MEKKALLVVGVVMAVICFAYGILEVKGSIPVNLQKINRHEMYMATQVASAEVAELEFVIQQRRGLLEYIQRNQENRDHSFYEFILAEHEKEISGLESRLKDLRGW